MERNRKAAQFIEVYRSYDGERDVEFVNVSRIQKFSRDGLSRMRLTVDGRELFMFEDLDHFVDRLYGGGDVAFLTGNDEAGVKTFGGASENSGGYTAEWLIDALTAEATYGYTECGTTVTSCCPAACIVSVCVRHNGDRTDCRISHLESKDGHITIVCDEEDDDN